MKRIIDGKTYNTETATRVAAKPDDFNNPEDHDTCIRRASARSSGTTADWIQTVIISSAWSHFSRR